MKKTKHFLMQLCMTTLAALSFEPLSGQTNEGINFDSGTLDGWQLYTGRYSCSSDGEYGYEWQETTEEQARREDRILLSGDVESVDPIIACSDFYVSPDQKSRVIRIGKNSGYAEGSQEKPQADGAYAERIVYDFTVTPQSTLFTYKYACVLHVPTGEAHTSYQMPSFNVSVTLTSPDSQKVTLPCESFIGGANFSDKSFQRNPSTCTAAKVEKNQSISDYIYKPWTTVSYDLKDYVGYHVNIEVVVHDCLVLVTGKEKAGSHKAYGYFWAETRPFELIPRNCGNDDAQITAPEGFVTYKWTCRETGESLRTKAGYPNIAVIPEGSIIDGAHYVCNLIGSNESCTNLEIDTVLHTIDLIPDFKYENACDLAIKFTDQTYVDRDTIRNYEWDFGDGITSVAKNPTHIYDEGGNYNVTLNVSTGNGCSQTVSRTITVQSKPTISVEGDQNVCHGDDIVLSVLSSAVGKAFFWLNQDGDTISNSISFKQTAESSQPYKVIVVDQNDCEYSKDIYVTVSASPTIFIKGDSSVCLNTPTKLWAWGDADSYAWSTGISGDTLNFIPQQSGPFSVTGTFTKTGCKTRKFVNVVVNPLPIVSVEGPEHICSGTTATLKATGANEYLWQDVYNGDSLTVSPSINTTYKVIGTDTNGCTNNIKYQLVVDETPNIIVHGNKAICEGDQLSLWLEGAQKYVWGDGTEGSSVTKLPALNTTSYTVTGSTNGCETTIEIPIEVNPVPTILIQGKNEICAGESISLFAQGGANYEWSTGETTDSIGKTLSSSQTFYVTGSTIKGCVSSVSHKVNVHPLPVFDITGPTSVCEESTVTLTASCENNDCTYQWDNGFLGAQFDAFISDTTEFLIRATDTAYGCSSNKTYRVFTFAHPVLKVAGNTTICSGTTTNLSVSGASTYKWNDGTTSSTLIMQPTNSMNLWVEGTTNGCTSKLDVPITVLQSPYIWVDGNTTICYGDTLYLTARGADSFKWNAAVEGEDYKSTPNISSSVSVIGTNTDGCTSKLVIPYTVKSKPTVGITGHETVCKDANVTMTATGSNLIQFVWSTGESNQTITVPVDEDKEFEVKAWDSNGCSNTAKHKVKTLLPPDITYTGKTTVCEGEEVVLLANGATNYTWTQNDAIFQQGDRLVYTPKTSTVIKLIGSESNCAGSIEIDIKVNSMPNLGIIGTTGICKNENFILTATGADHYQWSTGDTTATISYPLSIASTYMVTGTLNNGCSAKKTTRVEVFPDLNVSLEEVRKGGCPGEPTSVEMSAEGAMIYTWSSEPHNLTILGTTSYNIEALITEPTEVYVIGTDVNGCHGYDTLFIEPKTHDEISFQILPAIIEKEDPTVHFSGFKPKDTKWTWKPGDGSDALEGQNVTYRYSDVDVVTEDSFKVVVKAKDDEGCLYEQAAYVYVWKDIWAPTAFSPNGDGLNDIFRFQGGEYIEDFHFIIYDRLGTIMFEGNSIDDEWDGKTPKGEICTQGIYGWSVTYNSNYKGINKQGDKKGYITILK